jgi:hypothetical protein
MSHWDGGAYQLNDEIIRAYFLPNDSPLVGLQMVHDPLPTMPRV